MSVGTAASRRSIVCWVGEEELAEVCSIEDHQEAEMMSMAAIRGAGAPHAIETLGAFREWKASDRGVVVIADGTRLPPKAHAPGCSFVKEESFVEKVLTNGGKEGAYFFFGTLEKAHAIVDAKPCGHCGATP